MPNALQDQMGEDMATVDTASAYAELRAKYNGLIHTLFVKEKISSSAQVQQLTSWLDSIRGDHEAILEAHENFEKHALPLLEKEVQKKSQAASDLYNALKDGVISQDSYNEWMQWIEDTNRDAEEKMESMAETLPPYLNARRELAIQREVIVNSKGFAHLEHSKDPVMKGVAAKLSDLKYFLNTLSFEERKKAVVDAQSLLPVAEEELAVFDAFQQELEQAVSDRLISASSKKKWIARFKNPAINSKARIYFVQNQFPSYVQNWKQVKAQRKTLKEHEMYKELSEKDIKDFKTFDDDTKFTELHFNQKNNMLSTVKAALEAKKNGKTEKWKAANALLTSAVAAGIMSPNKVGGWLELIMTGKKTIKDLEKKKDEWAKLTSEFKKIELQFMKEGVPQGLQIMNKDQFLMLSTKKRKSYINLVKQRLDVKDSKDNSPMQDIKGKVRHALDTKEWDEARMFLRQAWQMAKTEEDFADLRSMENHLTHFGKESGANPEEDKTQAMFKAVQKIDAAMQLLPAPVRPIYEETLKKGNAGAIRCLGVLFYNVQWCLERGYLPRDLTKAEDRARQDTRSRLEPAGPTHIDGAIEFNDLKEYGSAAIPEDRWGPNVMVASSSEAGKIADSVDRNQNDFAYWYWGDLVVQGVSASEYEQLGLVTRKAITQGAYALEALGENYHSAKKKLSLDAFSAN